MIKKTPCIHLCFSRFFFILFTAILALGIQENLRADTRRSQDQRKEKSTATSAQAVQMNRHMNIAYAEAAGVNPNLLSLDIYAPKLKKECPVVVMIHGGGWQRGDKGNANVAKTKSMHFVREGCVFVSVNYRLSPTIKHPVHVQDVASALAWVHTHISEYGGDFSRIYIMGHSAGAHLAALVSTDARYLRRAGKELNILKGAVLLDSGAYNIPRMVDDLGRGFREMYETAFGKDRTVWKDASPFYHVEEGKGIPPFLIYHTGERLAGRIISREFSRELNKAGIPALAVHAIDRDHAGMNACIGTAGDVYTKQVMKFLSDPQGVRSCTKE